MPSDVGPTIPGISAAKLPQFALELALAVAQGHLQPGKFFVALQAANAGELETENLLNTLWAVALRYGPVEGQPPSVERERVAELVKECLKAGKVRQHCSLARCGCRSGVLYQSAAAAPVNLYAGSRLARAAGRASATLEAMDIQLL